MADTVDPVASSAPEGEIDVSYVLFRMPKTWKWFETRDEKSQVEKPDEESYMKSLWRETNFPLFTYVVSSICLGPTSTEETISIRFLKERPRETGSSEA